jgi:hypothetical protein
MRFLSSARRQRASRIPRSNLPARPELYVVKMHPHGCECKEVCRPHVPSDSDQLTDRDMGVLATIAGVVTIGVLYAINPAGTSEAILAMIGILS